MRRVLTIIIMLLVVGCYKVTITNTTHPETGVVEVQITLPTNLTELDDAFVQNGEESILPTSYTVEIAGESYTMDSDGRLTIPAYLDPGEYTIIIYSQSDKVSYVDGIASISTDVDGFVSYDPSLFLFGTQTLTVLEDSYQITQLEMSQIIGVVDIDLEVINGDPDNIVEATAVMSGVANQWDCIAETPYGDAVKISPPIAKGGAITRSGEDNNHLTSTLYLVGTNGDQQSLEMSLSLANGAIEVTTGDLSSLLAGFNLDKGSVVTISNTIWMPADVEIGALDVKIGDWIVSDTVLEGDTN